MSNHDFIYLLKVNIVMDWLIQSVWVIKFLASQHISVQLCVFSVQLCVTSHFIKTSGIINQELDLASNFSINHVLKEFLNSGSLSSTFCCTNFEIISNTI